MSNQKSLGQIILDHEKENASTVLKGALFPNGYKLLVKYILGGTVVCCWQIDSEYHEDNERPFFIYNNL